MITAASQRLMTRRLTTAHRRVFLTKASSPKQQKSKHAHGAVRCYQSTLKEAYFMANTAALPIEVQVQSARQSWWQQFKSWYSDKLVTHPLMTKGLTGAIIAATGDVLCQAGTFTPTDGKKTSFWLHGWDVRRSFHFFVLGLTFVAPTSHYWYGGMAVHPWTRGQSFYQISKRVALDQFVWTPVFFVIWLSGFWTMEANGHVTGNQIQNQLTTHLPDVMMANWLLWIPAQYLNFYACPVKFQVLFTNVVELAWNAYLSFATSGEGGHGGGKKKEQPAPEVQ
ncbi:Peroxisomal membrane protein 2 [Seminavis robusta]|uniref:Peroxisomal membrane protein 2 n=1 Tax=Seminavis robusta TaxID=568900 RepID=A0A9N8DGP1_9STRA|nr:Peroxisomal membrane protein 2 [Seminavis robusta]|eukprot:Sro136_g063980.1 Peroxisomal membrane protein 2 (281) ;mRNA; f:17831-18769